MQCAEVLEDFQTALPQETAKKYIAQVKPNDKHSRADALVFNAPNAFFAKFVQTKYGDKIAHSYEAQSGVRASVRILAPGQERRAAKRGAKVDVGLIKAQSTILNPSFTFASFVEGDSNKYAYSTCRAVADKNKLGRLYNPIFIYGPTGLGKTHLLQAVGNECLQMGKLVIYATSENFVNDFTSQLKNNTMEKFQEKYRNCDVLLIDDVQFLGKTDRIQEEFFHIFNELKNKNAQLIMSSDSPPNLLKGITERLKSRFVHGIIADITPPELETKIVIIKKKCEFNEVSFSDELISYIATTMGDNIREIEGMITNLNAYSRLINQEITLDIAKAMMKDHIKESKDNVSVEDILAAVCKDCNVKVSEVKSGQKTKKLVLARRMVIYLARELTGASMPALAMLFEMKDHTAISHNIKKIKEMISMDFEIKNRIEDLRRQILMNCERR